MRTAAVTLALCLLALPAVAGISMSDADGQALVLEQLSVKAAIHGPLSLTELELRFRNPKPRRVEGRFECTLPPNAAISRFAKEVNGQLMEGEVVERLRANQVYEQFLHQMRDPALLEQDQGNRFSARIFPIDANATVRILLSYSMLLPVRGGVRTYTLPLRGMQQIGQFTFRAYVSPLTGEGTADRTSGLSRSTSDMYSQDERDYAPDHDVVLTFHPSADAGGRVLTAGDFYLASFRPDIRVKQAADPHNWLFYVDTSASAAENAEQRIAALESLLAALPSSDRVEVKAFDNDVATLGAGTATEMSYSIRQLLQARLFLGGTDLGSAIRDAARNATGRHIVFVSDFVATLGATEANDIANAVRAFPAPSRVDALIVGSREDARVTKALTAGRGRVVHASSEDIALLQRPLGASLDVADPAAEWVYPLHVTDVQAGDEVIVLGKMRDSVAVRLGAIETPRIVPLANETFGPLLEREAYRAYLQELAERESSEPSEGVRKALQTEQVRISVEQRVVIPLTTMLVLETEFDYQRFGLDRRALAAILTIEGGSIARLDRRSAQPRPLPVTPGKAMIQPSPMPVPVTQERQQAAAQADMSVRAEAKDVVGGVVGGVAGGIAMNAPATAPPPPPSAMGSPGGVVAEAITVAPRRARPVEARKTETPSWTARQVPTRAEIAALEEAVKRDPRNRESYNQLSEALAAAGRWRELRRVALAWQPYDPENPQVYESLGNADEHLDDRAEAARAYASLIEVAAGKPELLQRAGLLLVRVGRASLGEAPLRRALQLRPDRVNSYRHLALMLWLDGRPDEAARVLESATRQTFPNWYGDAQRVIREELGYVYRAILNKSPEKSGSVFERAREFHVDLNRRDALRMTLAWETDANDVDLHVVDPNGEECFYGHNATRTGLALYQDITQGLGPEVIRTESAKKGTYHVGVQYFSAGPMGVSRGIVVTMRDRGEGRDPAIEVVPFRLVEGGREMRHLASVIVR